MIPLERQQPQSDTIRTSSSHAGARSNGMIVYVFGNPDLPQDSLPLKILPQLRQKFPQINFDVKDPNEEWDVPEELTVIDTVQGINQVEIFHDLDKFQTSPRISLHDFDALSQLRLLKKIGKLKKVTVIGIPPEMNESEALEAVAKKLNSYS